MTDSHQRFRRIVITGASSGIGEGLALAYAAPEVFLGLTGRDHGRLEKVANAARARGATVEAVVIDVRDRKTMTAWLTALDDRHPIDLVIANAGISGGSGGVEIKGDHGRDGESAEQTRFIMDINIDGVINTVLPLLDRMRGRRSGQIGIMASLAGFRGMPAAPAYCASKAAVRVWGEGLRGMVARDNVGVSVICPGFVRSRITDANDFPMPFFMETAPAAAIIRRGLAANRSRIAFPWPMALAVWLLALLPPAWTDWMIRLSPRKPAQPLPPPGLDD